MSAPTTVTLVPRVAVLVSRHCGVHRIGYQHTDAYDGHVVVRWAGSNRAETVPTNHVRPAGDRLLFGG